MTLTLQAKEALSVACGAVVRGRDSASVGPRRALPWGLNTGVSLSWLEGSHCP